jgi:phosphatidate cytidylyltransferase
MPAGELARRWAVAVVGVPLVVGLLYAGSWLLGAAVAVMGALGADECFRLAARKGVQPVRWVGLPLAASFGLVAAHAHDPTTFAAIALAVLGAAVLVALLVVTFHRGADGAPLASAGITLFGAMYAGLSLAVVPLLHAVPLRMGWAGAAPSPWAGVAVVALPLASTWIGDATAFFAGTAWGRRRLAPAISPKKSWEGAVAGVLGASAGAVAWYAVVRGIIPAAPVSILSAAVVGAVLGAAAIFGDLAESVLKREAGVKDSGTLFPGHGGVLDRIDALVFTLPIALGLLQLLEWLR